MAEDRWHREKEAERQKFVSELIENKRMDYESSGNPICAWFAYHAARESGRSPPAWTLEYLDEVAKGFWELWYDSGSDHKISPSEILKAVKLAGIRGKETAFSSYEYIWAWSGIAERVGSKISQGDKETYAIEDVAKWSGASKSTVRRYWKRYQSEYPEQVNDPLSSTKHPIS